MKTNLRRNLRDFMIGADPEFCAVNGNQLIVAGNYVDIDEKFGRDAYDKLFELKPDPSNCPIQVVKNMHSIMQKAIIDNPEFAKWRWVCDSFYKNCPMGGHLHAGIKGNIISAKEACTYYLDHYVGPITLLLEDREKGLARRNYRRKNYRYGFASDFREKAHGFEYRTPSSWITNPHIAIAILSLFKTVCYEMLNNKAFRPNVYVSPEDFDTMNVDKIKRLFPNIWSDISQMTLYPKYKKHLDLIYRLITRGQNWLSKKDMKTTWGINNLSKFYPRKLNLDDIWSEYTPILREEKREEIKKKNEFLSNEEEKLISYWAPYSSFEDFKNDFGINLSIKKKQELTPIRKIRKPKVKQVKGYTREEYTYYSPNDFED